MSDTRHPPLPWTSKGRVIADEQSWSVATVCTGRSPEDPEATAAFIAHRVNAHDALVDALRDLLAVVELYDSKTTKTRTATAARAALALAEEKGE